MSELKKCPFCGCEAELNWHGWIGVDCTGCTCSLGDGGEFTTEREAVAAWNLRAEPDIGKAIAELVKETLDEVGIPHTNETGGFIFNGLSRADHSGETADMMWISVEDRLPEPSNEHQARMWVIVALKSGCVKEARFDFGCPNYGFESMGSDITHWMPLPQPPKEETT